MAVLDERELGAALRGVAAADQPTQPLDRLAAVTGRARRTRRRQTLATGLAVVAVALPAALLATSSPSARPQPVHVAGGTPVEAWPDRSAPDDRAVADGAVTAWRASAEGTPGTSVRWLYRGDVRTPDDRRTYVAVWLSGAPGEPRQVVTASANRVQVDANGDDVNGEPADRGSPWSTAQQPVPQGPSAHVGLYVRSLQPRGNSVFLLADPAVREARWTADPLPAAPAQQDDTPVRRSGVLTSPDGLFTAYVGPLDGRLRVALVTPDLPAPLPVPLTSGRDDPLVVDAPALVLPPGSPESAGISGQSQPQEGGRYAVDTLQNGDGTTGRGWQVVASCYGAGRLTIRLAGHRGSIACDGGTHQPFPAVRGRLRPEWLLEPSATGLIGYRITVATVR